MQSDKTLPATIENYKLVKYDGNGEIFEIVEGGDHKEDKVTFRRPGQPETSYANLPFEPEGNIYVT